MAKKRLLVVGAGVVMAIGVVRWAMACGGYGDFRTILESQIVTLREQGPAGLANALTALDQVETSITDSSRRMNELASDSKATNESQAALRGQLDELVMRRDAWKAAVDQIGGQRSCTVSRLFWYTDLDKAKAEAERTGRPILSLRMLGKLTDEFSCANSRFFRTSLYSNEEISQYLRNNFVLHWQSVRPVSKVTIDFGDGRKLERTLTGNSAHFVLASTGQPLDVLPGLYSPAQFQSWLSQMKGFHQIYVGAPEAKRSVALANYHASLRDAVLRKWDADIQRLGEQQAAIVMSRLGGAPVTVGLVSNGNEAAPGAQRAGAAAFGKGKIEMPVLRFANLGGENLEKAMDESLWQSVASLHRDEVKLDAASVALMRAEFPNARQAGLRAESKYRVEDPLLRIVRQFEESIGLDTVRNEYLLHRRIHEQFAAGEAVTANVDQLNEWVYATLFLTPSSDPWLGLAPPDVYTALENGGQVVATSGAAAGRE